MHSLMEDRWMDEQKQLLTTPPPLPPWEQIPLIHPNSRHCGALYIPHDVIVLTSMIKASEKLEGEQWHTLRGSQGWGGVNERGGVTTDPFSYHPSMGGLRTPG